MAKVAPWVVVAAFSFLLAGRAADNDAKQAKTAVEALLHRLDQICHDPEMTTAKKSLVSAEEMEKFHQQHKGQTLTVRLKIQDIAPHTQGYCATAGNPDLSYVQFPTTRFQVGLTKAQVLSIGKEGSLLVTGQVNVVSQLPLRPHPTILAPGGTLVFSLRANSNYKLCLEKVAYRVENVTTAIEDLKPPEALPADALSALEPPVFVSKPAAKKDAPASKKAEQLHSADEIKSFFLRGIAVRPLQSPGKKSVPTRPALPSGAGKSQHNRIYTKDELIRIFGNPASATSVMAEETWIYKCRDGTVRVRFKQVGSSGSPSAYAPARVRLEIQSVDSNSQSGGRF